MHGTGNYMVSLGRIMAKHEQIPETAFQPRAHAISEVIRSMLAVTTHLYDVRIRTKTSLFILLHELGLSRRLISVRFDQIDC